MMDVALGHVGRAIVEAWKTGCFCKLIRDWKSRRDLFRHAPTHKSEARESAESADAYCTRQRLDDEPNTIQTETKSPTK